MTPDEHQRERMRAWVAVAVAKGGASVADLMLQDFDLRFPAPAAVEVASKPAETPMLETPMLFARTLAAMEERDAAAELTTLRDKARLWDVVASGKVRMIPAPGNLWRVYYGDGECTEHKNPAEAVQAAIDAGALE